ncbi:MAG: hypothetical protein JWQ23_958 [Herminiimonas sp.]|nr:hypothetical protein [Herminiimonas sp.]
MKISATRSGGYAGLAENYYVDTALLADPQRSAIEGQVEKVRFFNAPPEVPPGSVGADLDRWEITITDRHRQRTVSFYQDGSPDTADWQALTDLIRRP